MFDVLHAVSNPDTVSTHEIDELERRSKSLKSAHGRWQREYNVPLSKEMPRPASPADIDIRTELLGLCLVLQAVACRLVGATSPKDRVAVEAEAITKAMQARHLAQDARRTNPRASFYLEQKVLVTETILATTEMWLEETQEPPTSRLIDHRKYVAWCTGTTSRMGV
jgi:hypothetical protein